MFLNVGFFPVQIFCSSLRMFIMFTLSFKTNLRSFWKLLQSCVYRSLRQAVPDHLQRFPEFDDRLRLWMTLTVIASNVAPAMV